MDYFVYILIPVIKVEKNVALTCLLYPLTVYFS
jgi:hypothetical protein